MGAVMSGAATGYNNISHSYSPPDLNQATVSLFHFRRPFCLAIAAFCCVEVMTQRLVDLPRCPQSLLPDWVVMRPW